MANSNARFLCSKKPIKREKTIPVVVAHLGLAYLRQNKDDKALAMLSRWAELEPNSADALYFKGKASIYVASDSFAQLSKTAPDSYRMFQLRAEMLRQQGMTPGCDRGIQESHRSEAGCCRTALRPGHRLSRSRQAGRFSGGIQ